MRSLRRQWAVRRERCLRFSFTLAAAALVCGARGATRALAHGPVPTALSIVDEDAAGPTLVRLNSGLARRESADVYRYVCPAAWGDEVVLPAARIVGGPAVVAGGRGLFLIDPAGRVTTHPDPNAAGSSIDFAVIGEQLFVLRIARGVTEVLEVDATRVRRIFSESGNWTTIAATSDAIGLQRLHESRIEQLRIAPDGTVIDRVSAPEPDDSILVLARATSRELYAVLTTPAGRELGRIESGRWVRLEAASASIAGPVETPDGEPFVALDSELIQLPEPRGALEGLVPVSCLGRLGSLAYACTRDGLSVLSSSGLSGPLFELSSLQPPDLALVDEAQSEACQVQWQHFRFDLLALGLTLNESPAQGGAGGATGAGGAKAPSAADGGEADPAGDADGCASVGVGSSPPSTPLFALGAFGAAVCARRIRSGQRRRSIEQAT